MIGSGKNVRVRREMEFRYEQYVWTVRVLVEGEWVVYWEGRVRDGVSLHDAMTVAHQLAVRKLLVVRMDQAARNHRFAKGGVLPVDFGGPMPVAAVTGCSYLRPLPTNHDLLRKINEGHPF